MKLVAKLNIATLQQYTHVSSNYILHLIVYFVHKSWRKLWVFQVFQVCENLNGNHTVISICAFTHKLRMIMNIVTYCVSLHLSSEGTTKLKEDHPHSKHINLLCLIPLYRQFSPLLWAHVKGNIAARLSFWPGRIRGYRE